MIGGGGTIRSSEYWEFERFAKQASYVPLIWVAAYFGLGEYVTWPVDHYSSKLLKFTVLNFPIQATLGILGYL